MCRLFLLLAIRLIFDAIIATVIGKDITWHYGKRMDYIPKSENRVAKGRSKEGIPYWDPLTVDDLEKCLDPSTPPEQLELLFPGPCFFGRLVGPAGSGEMISALSVLKMTRELHGALKNSELLFRLPDAEVTAFAERIEELVRGCGAVTIVRGDGYSDQLEGEPTIPKCHILAFKIDVPPVYAEWLKPRVGSYRSLGTVFEAEMTYYLHISNEMRLEETGNGATLHVDIYGTQSLLSDFEPWLTQYEKDLPEDTILSGLELVAGLLHLADALATMHLVTALPVISHGQFLRTTASDNLTDLWLMCYDISSDANYSIGVCEVCHRLFIGSNKNKRGHKECMNRQRVAKSRARRFKKLVDGGVADEEASKIAGINPKKAWTALGINPKALNGETPIREQG